MKNRYLKPLLRTLLLFAVVHFVILLFMLIATFNIEYINIFRVLGLNELLPGIEKGETSFLVSSFIAFTIYLIFFLRKNK